MPERTPPFKVLIAGGGVAALEATLALRELVGERAAVELLAPSDDFYMKPLAVAESFGFAEAARIPLAEIAGDLGATHRRDSLSGIDVEGSVARTGAGDEIPYDAALIAIGAIAGEALPGALTYRGGPDNARIDELLAELDAGTVSSVVFVIPPAAQWPFPIYELALMTAFRIREGGSSAKVSLVTYEPKPLDMFGPRASDSVTELLRDGGVELIAGAKAATSGGAGVMLGDGRVIIGDRVIAGARLSVPEISGIPQDAAGFIDTDMLMEVEGAPRVYAAGDSTWFPIKQGGIAAQQADVAASAIASLIDPGIEPEPFRPTLRGVLFTGAAPRFLRGEVGQARIAASVADGAPLWWPPSKVAGKHLASYLARRQGEEGPLEDLEPVEGVEDLAAAEDANRESFELALASAEAEARDRDYRAALRWLDVAESINLSLPAEYGEKRRLWAAEARG